MFLASAYPAGMLHRWRLHAFVIGRRHYELNWEVVIRQQRSRAKLQSGEYFFAVLDAGLESRENDGMKWRALACDYDGTLAHDGVVRPSTAAAIDRFRQTGRHLFMVTGRELPELKQVCPILDRFEWVVAENGALLHRPASNQTRLLCEPPSQPLVESLRRFEIKPLSVGQAIIATVEPNEVVVLEEIKRLGLELQVIFNKGSVMVLPSGVNKATGLTALLKESGVSADEVVGVGDAENDHAFLQCCGIGVAVANALPMLKERADHVTKGARGDGVAELIDMILVDDLTGIKPRR